MADGSWAAGREEAGSQNQRPAGSLQSDPSDLLLPAKSHLLENSIQTSCNTVFPLDAVCHHLCRTLCDRGKRDSGVGKFWFPRPILHRSIILLLLLMRLFVRVCMYTHVRKGAHGGQRVQMPLELELLVIIRTELRASAGAAHTLNL